MAEKCSHSSPEPAIRLSPDAVEIAKHAKRKDIRARNQRSRKSFERSFSPRKRQPKTSSKITVNTILTRLADETKKLDLPMFDTSTKSSRPHEPVSSEGVGPDESDEGVVP